MKCTDAQRVRITLAGLLAEAKYAAQQTSDCVFDIGRWEQPFVESVIAWRMLYEQDEDEGAVQAHVSVRDDRGSRAITLDAFDGDILLLGSDADEVHRALSEVQAFLDEAKNWKAVLTVAKSLSEMKPESIEEVSLDHELFDDIVRDAGA